MFSNPFWNIIVEKLEKALKQPLNDANKALKNRG